MMFKSVTGDGVETNHAPGIHVQLIYFLLSYVCEPPARMLGPPSWVRVINVSEGAALKRRRKQETPEGLRRMNG